MKLFISVLLTLNLYGLVILDKPIVFDKQRITLTKKYISAHYGLKPTDISIIPRIIVVHWTAEDDLEKSFNHFKDPTLSCDRAEIRQASALNVSAHFLVDRQGEVYRLMPENYMARHTIGLNYSAIAIENVGGEKSVDNLTPAQLHANIQLIKYLKNAHPTIKYLIGHHEYTECKDLDLWLEKDKDYETLKYDPGDKFMQALRQDLPSFKNCVQGKK